jgi:NAD(P)-dependent dehydrogenase (short-subunit alcohol dehydrogenase family)
VLLKPGRAFATGDQTLYSTTLGWRMVNPRMPGEWMILPGASTEKLAGLHGVGREAQFALTGFTQALGAEVRPHDVPACLVYPGAMATHWGT